MKIKKLYDELARVADTGRAAICGIKITQSDYDDLWDICKNIYNNNVAYSINSKSIKILKKLNFKTTVEGIGWMIRG